MKNIFFLLLLLTLSPFTHAINTSNPIVLNDVTALTGTYSSKNFTFIITTSSNSIRYQYIHKPSKESESISSKYKIEENGQLTFLYLGKKGNEIVEDSLAIVAFDQDAKSIAIIHDGEYEYALRKARKL